MIYDPLSSPSDLSVHPHLPVFGGTFSTEEAERALAADDFGHYMHCFPSAVLSPSSPEDIVRVVQFARQNGLKIAPRGQGHSTGGQAQAEAGIVVNMTSLNSIVALHEDRVEVEAGVLWATLLETTLAEGLTPPVYPDYLGLSVGGVLSVGGIGGTSYRCGAVVDNVLELQVVTGAGQLETCSPTHQRELFESVLAGLGQYGIIVKATLRLVPVQTHARVFHLSYADLATCMRDEKLLLDGERFDSLVGYIVPSPFGTWDYILEAARFYTPDAHQPDNDHLLQGLSFIAGMEQIEDMSYLAFSSRVAMQVEGLKATGGWDLSHPWFDVLVPGSEVEQYISGTLAEISPIDFGFSFILFNGLRSNSFHTPLLRIPAEETFFLFDVFRAVMPNSDTLTNALTHNRKLMERNYALGGKCYPIGTHEFSPADWKTQYGSSWETVQRAKERFDPDNVLAPGQGIFPSS